MYIFRYKNYLFFMISIIFIICGYYLMTGFSSNENNVGLDVNFWNENIYSFVRIRLSCIFIFIGLVFNILSIFYNKYL